LASSTLYRDRPGDLPAGQLATALMAADAAALALLYLGSGRHSRVVIEQAKGVLAERNAVHMNASFEALRQYARNHNLKLTELALAVVRGDVEPGAIVARSPAS